MRAKKKLIISMLVVSFVLLSIIATVAIAFALTQQTIKTTLNIGYTVEDIDGTASATFTIGGVTENLTAMKGTQVIGDKLVFKAGDTEDAGNLMFPEDALALSAQNDNVVIQYTYSNTGAKHYIASMDFAANIEADNMKVEYSIDGTTYSENRYAVVVPANTSNRSYWIKISIEDKAKSASFTGDFDWVLNGCDEQADDYLTIASTEFQATGTVGEYSVKLNGDGYLPGGQVVFPSEVNGDPVTTIAANESLTQAQKNMVKKISIPNNVTTIQDEAFADFANLENVVIETAQAGTASANSNKGLQSIGSYEYSNFVTNGAFKNCIKLKNITIPNTVKTIGSGTFYGCVSLEEIIIPSSVETLGYYLFQGCTALRDCTFMPGVSCELQEGMFDGCVDLNLTTVPGVYFTGEWLLGNVTYNTLIISEGFFSSDNGYPFSSIVANKLILRDDIVEYSFQNSNIGTLIIDEQVLYINRVSFRGSEIGEVIVNGSLNWEYRYYGLDFETYEDFIDVYSIEFSDSDYVQNARSFLQYSTEEYEGMMGTAWYRKTTN